MTGPLSPIPTPDPLGLPGPVPLLQVLLVLGFLLHALFMNLVLGGTPIMLLTEALALRTGKAPYRRLADTLAAVLPGAMALAVVFGVAPLLFVQVLYGPFFYSATILIGHVWLTVIALLIAGYSGLYLYKYGPRWFGLRPGLRLGLGGLCALLFLCVALVFVTMSVLTLTPDRWRTIHATGFATAVGLPSVLPRYLHLVLAAVAGAGLVITLYGWVLGSRWGPRLGVSHPELPGYDLWVLRYGLAWTLGATLPQVVIGPWFLMTLPSSVRAALLLGGGLTSMVFFTALTFALLAIVLMNAALLASRVRGLALGAMGSLALTVVLMAVIRDRVRHYALLEHFDPASLATTPQRGWIWLFAILLLATAGVVGYLLAVTIRARRGTTSGDSSST